MMRSLALALVTISVLACSSKSKGPDPADDEHDGKVVEISGEVTAQREGSKEVRTLAMDSDVFGNDTITTAEDASVKIRLLHNGAVWFLDSAKKRTLAKTGAWKASTGTAGVFDESSGGQTAAAGRHAERQGADTRATAETTRALKKPDERPRHMVNPDDPLGGVGETGGSGKGPSAGEDSKTRKVPGGGKPERETEGPKSRMSYRSAAKPETDASKESLAALQMKLQKAYAASIRACHERVLATNPDAAGIISIEIDVGEDGRVVEARQKGFDGELAACILEKAKAWSFEPLKDASGTPIATTVRFDVELRPE